MNYELRKNTKVRTKNKLIFIVILLVILQGGLLFVFFSREKVEPTKETHRSLYISKDFFEEAYSSAGAGFDFNESKPKAAITPHHLAVKDRIASLFTLLSKYNYDQVIMIGPDHLNDAGYDIVTSSTNWTTPYGELKVDSDFTNKLLQTDFVDLSERGMAEEFAVSGLVPFVKKSWPKTKFVPIIIETEIEKEKVDQLIDFIQKNKSQNSLLIASVDFSHYKNADEAEIADKNTNSVIKNLEIEKSLDVWVDSPQSIYTLLSCAVKSGVENTKLLSHTNTGLMSKAFFADAVTHNIWIFW